MTQRNTLHTNGYILQTLRANGKIQVTLNGATTTYNGNRATVNNEGQLCIDEQTVTPNDPRQIPNDSLSLISPAAKKEWEDLASKDGLNVTFDSCGNITFSRR